MRKNTIISIVALVLTIAAFITIKPLWLEDGRKHNQPNNLTIKNLPIQTVQHNQFGKMQKVDMLHANHEIIRKLNSNPSIKLIHHNKMDKSHYYDHEVIVNFKAIPNQKMLNQFIRDIDGSVKESHETAFIFKSNSKTTADLEKYFAANKLVEYAEPHYVILQNEVNDTFYQGYQWNLPAIGTEDGWNLSRGSKDVKIAVIDTGVDLDHPDLTRRLTKGYNALADSYNPDDDNGHGSHVAGIIASETNNGTGMAGITWYNPIIPVKVMGADGTGGSFYVAKGIRWAVDHGANVINLSLGVYQSCELLEESIRYALEKDVVVVSAAGNDNTNQPSFPAAYPGVLGVAAVDSDGTRATFSNYGNYIDVAAPGVDIPSTFSDGRYAALSGTSMAAPHVAALAGLIRSVNPKLKNTDVVKIIKRSTQPTDQQGPNPYFGNGIIDNVKALQMASKAK